MSQDTRRRLITRLIPRPRRSWVRFGLRSLIVVVTLAAVTLGGYRTFVQPFQLQAEVRSAILAARGSCTAEPAPVWLRWFFNDDDVCVLTGLDFTPAQTQSVEEFLALPRPGTPRAQAEGRMRDWVQAQIPLLTELRSLNVSRQDVTDAEIAGWQRLTHLESLDVSETWINDPSTWPAFPLRELNASANFLTDDDASGIARFRGLRVLDLSSTAITDFGMPTLASLVELEELNVAFTGITEDSCDALSSLPKLDLLSVMPNMPMDPVIFPERFDSLLGLTAFEIVSGRTRGDGVIIRKRQQRLTDPYWRLLDDLHFNQSEVDETIELLRFERPDRKECVFCFESEIPLEFIDANPQIESLLLGNSFLGANDLKRLPLFGRLRSLSLRQMCLTAASLSSLNDVPHLESLDLTHSSVTDEGIVQLEACLPRLRELNLGSTMITDATLARLAEAKSLRTVHLEGTLITDAGLRHLAELPELEEIWLPPERIRGPGLSELLRAPRLANVVFWEDNCRVSGWRERWRYPVPNPAPLTKNEVRHFVKLAEHLAVHGSAAFVASVEEFWDEHALATTSGASHPHNASTAIVLYLLHEFPVAPDAETILPDAGMAYRELRAAAPPFKVRTID